MLLAEADRARYGVFRQADFGGATADPVMLEDLPRSAAELAGGHPRMARSGEMTQKAASTPIWSSPQHWSCRVRVMSSRASRSAG